MSKTVINASTVVALCIKHGDDVITARTSKGQSLLAAHEFLDVGNKGAELHKAASAARETAGGKDAPPKVKAGYKLAKRYADCAIALERVGLTFASIGAPLTEKSTFTVTLCEYATAAGKDNAERAAYHAAWVGAPKGSTVQERCTLGEAAARAVVDADKAAARAALFAEVRAMIAAEEATKAAPKAAPKKQRVTA